MTKVTRMLKRVQAGHRARKRKSEPLQPTGKGRDARKAERRSMRAAYINGLVEQAELAALEREIV